MWRSLSTCFAKPRTLDTKSMVLLIFLNFRLESRYFCIFCRFRSSFWARRQKIRNRSLHYAQVLRNSVEFPEKEKSSQAYSWRRTTHLRASYGNHQLLLPNGGVFCLLMCRRTQSSQLIWTCLKSSGELIEPYVFKVLIPNFADHSKSSEFSLFRYLILSSWWSTAPNPLITTLTPKLPL